MAFFSMAVLEGMEHLSEIMNIMMCNIVGTSKEVALRRELQDIKEMFERRIKSNNVSIEMLSGSMREGFRLKGSDFDIMFWSNNHRVIMDRSQSENYNTAKTILILSHISESPPGYTLLELLTPEEYLNVHSLYVRENNRIYISSSKYKKSCLSEKSKSTVHGPCINGSLCNLAGRLEYDAAVCFVSDYWPPSASQWINRCHSWPDPEVVGEIIRNGCHFVAIGHPLGPHENEEWRISFSRAEYKLVYAMNHCQFITYGLLKLFLKEVINQQSEETNKLLCSYHIKTAVFWAIQQNTLPYWCPQNLLAGFWVCFKLLLKWVYKGVCPNFFIPQNNLFLTKVYDSAQNRLFLQLHKLYKKGLACLLQSSCFRSYIINVLYNPRLSVCTDKTLIRSEVDYYQERYLYMQSDILKQNPDLGSCIKYIRSVEQLIGLPLTRNQGFSLMILTTSILIKTSFLLHDMYSNKVNKQIYIVDKISYHMLKLAAKFGCVSSMLYIAMYYYKTLRYREALSVIEMTKVKLAQPYLMYMEFVDRQRYIEAVGGQSWSTKMRRAIAYDIKLHYKICYINELIPEQQSALQNNLPSSNLVIPLFVTLHFLEFLCYRHIDATLSQAALDDLQALVHHDQGLYVHDIHRDISWEILGICQQITWNLQAALYSYKQSLITSCFDKVKTATQWRIHDIKRAIADQYD